VALDEVLAVVERRLRPAPEQAHSGTGVEATMLIAIMMQAREHGPVPEQQHASRAHRGHRTHLGFGRIAVSEKEVPNMLVILV
jgi:hypothetical protein